MTERRFGFVQWEFAGRLGPDPGRYPATVEDDSKPAEDRWAALSELRFND